MGRARGAVAGAAAGRGDAAAVVGRVEGLVVEGRRIAGDNEAGPEKGMATQWVLEHLELDLPHGLAARC